MFKLSDYDPVLHLPIYFLLFNTIWTFLVGEFTGNVSQVDRVWTFLPVIYTTYYALLPALPFAPKDVQDAGLNHRVVLMAALQAIWMTRLSFNTWRRGLFALTEEDYRWQILRDNTPVSIFKVFNLVFIAATQNWILYGLGYPAYLTLRNPNTPLDFKDALLTALALLDLLTEFVGDNQQYSFQTWKHSKPRVQKPDEQEWFFAKQRWTEADAKRGFVTRGLWAWSRHPNFLAEQIFWWIMVFFPIVTGPGTLSLPSMDEVLSSSTYSSFTTFINTYAGVGPIVPGLVITLLFLGSTTFTEWISARKYPTYKAYQRRVGMFLPIGTIASGWYLSMTGKKGKIDQQIWGTEKVEKAE